MQLVEQGFEFVIGDQPIIGRCCAGRWRSGGSGRHLRQGFSHKGAFAMQLVEKCLELVVGDVGAGVGSGCFWRSGRRGHGICCELAFAVQLVEQRLEFGVGNVFTARRRGRLHRRFSFGLDRAEGVEQLFELTVGHVRLGLRHRLRRSLDHRHSRGVGRFGQARQGGQQFRGGSGDRRTFTHLAEHAVDRIQCFENHVHQFRVDVTLTLAQDVEDVLGDVAALHQLMELEEAGAPFYSVKTAKNCIEQVRIIRSAFQLDQLFGQLL